MIFIPHKVVRGEMIALAVIIRDFLPILIIVIIQERDLFALIDCCVDIIYQVVNLLIHRFDTLGNIDIPFQSFRLIHACHLRQLIRKLRAFLCRNEFRGFHRINQQLHFRQGKQMTAKGIAVLTASFFFNINANVTELRNVARYRLATHYSCFVSS